MATVRASDLGEAVNPIEASLRAVARDLDQLGRDWALVGGLAVSARVEPRTTRDVDLAVAVTGDKDAETLTRSLQTLHYQFVDLVEQAKVTRLAKVRMLPPEGGPEGVLIDLIFALSGIEPEIATSAEQLEILPGVTIPVATIGHLIALKILARDDRKRPQDFDDIQALLREADQAELDCARDALQLIEDRGYSRGKKLLRELEGIVDGRA